MSEPGADTNSQAPEGTETGIGMAFQVVRPALGSGGARVGKFCLPNRVPLPTPSYIAMTSRGAVPHLTTDNLVQHTSLEAAYMALEDFIEKKDPPLYQAPSESGRTFHSFTAFPSDRITVLASRRIPPVTTPQGNGNKHVSIFTSTGFRNVPVSEYSLRVAALRPDIAVALADLPHTSASPPAKKLVRMVDRTEDWLGTFLKTLKADPKANGSIAVFAPILPIERPIQWQYFDRLSDELAPSLSGLALYNVDSIRDLAHYKPLEHLPRLVLEPPRTPHHLLRQVSLGADICIAPFINDASDAGTALTFTFPAPHTDPSNPLPLGVNLWAPEHKTAVQPLMEGCECYACTKHHRAFIHHLLDANEMLAWTLLQVHNHHVVTKAFEGVRAALGAGEAVFEWNVRVFGAAYERELPQGMGIRPRARGYHFKSQGGDKGINDPAWQNMNAEGQSASEAGGAERADAVPKKME